VKDPKQSTISYTKVNRAVTKIAKELQISTKYERNASSNHSHRCAETLAWLFTPEYLKYMMSSPMDWPLSNDCLENYEHGKYMLPLGQLIEEPWEIGGSIAGTWQW
jgi:hypothetical protein